MQCIVEFSAHSANVYREVCNVLRHVFAPPVTPYFGQEFTVNHELD
jgi:hypothetical protein